MSGRGREVCPTVDMEWIADTGSAQDLISGTELQDINDSESTKPINTTTADGPNYADRQCQIGITSIGTIAQPYVLPDSPSVLSVGQNCIFVWRANCRPFLLISPLPGVGGARVCEQYPLATCSRNL